MSRRGGGLVETIRDREEVTRNEGFILKHFKIKQEVVRENSHNNKGCFSFKKKIFIQLPTSLKTKKH